MDVLDALRARIEAAVCRDLACPVKNRAAAPVAQAWGQRVAPGAFALLDDEVVERSVEVAQAKRAACAVERRFDHRILPRGQMPRAGESGGEAGCEAQLGG